MNRVVLAGLGPDQGGDPLATLAAELRDSGSEVIFTGWKQNPAQLVTTALQEDVDAIGVCGATQADLADIRARLGDEGAEDITVFIPDGVTSRTSPDRGQQD